MGEGESEVLGDELLDVGALDVLGLLDLNNAEDLDANCQYLDSGTIFVGLFIRGWI